MRIMPKGVSVTISIPVIDQNSMGTGLTVTYEVVDASDSPVTSGTMTESAVQAGIYYANITISTVGEYRIYFSCPTYPSYSLDVRVQEVESFVTDIKDESLGKWVLDPVANTLTIYRTDDTVLKVFSLTEATETVPDYKQRTPQ